MAKLRKQNFLSIKWKFGVPLIWQTDFNEPIPIRDSWICRITCKWHNNTQTPRTSSGFVCNQLFSKRLIPISSRDKIQLDAMKSNLIAFSIFIRQNIYDSSGSVEQIQNGNSFQSKIYMYIQWILCIQWCCYCCWWWWRWFHRLASCNTDSIILLNDLFVLLFFVLTKTLEIQRAGFWAILFTYMQNVRMLNINISKISVRERKLVCSHFRRILVQIQIWYSNNGWIQFSCRI